MNYTRPNNIDREDTPQDWLNASLLFASALGYILKEKEGVVVDIKGDVNIKDLLNENCKKVFVYASEEQIHIKECWDDIPAGTLVWMHDTSWYCQYLEGEKMWYMTEHHPENGIEGEHFFETEEEVDAFITKHNIILDYGKEDK
jgi:hypothetical protein